MPLAFEDLRVLQLAEAIADATWKTVMGWQPFAREAMGKQFIQAADSIGANIAGGFGRSNYGEKVTFFHYARGSTFETKYWLNRAVKRELVDDHVLRDTTSQLAELARQLNALVAATKRQRTALNPSRSLRESSESYDAADAGDAGDSILVELFSPADLAWLEDINYPLPVTNYPIGDSSA
jgi:four helix bundle protein